MEIINKISKTLCFLYLFTVLQACTDNLDEHVNVTDPNLQETLTQRISEDPQLSEFSSLLERSGYDAVLNSSKTYTVWAPTNDALAQVPDGVLNDDAKLEQFMQNHIALSSFTTGMVQDTVSVEMLTQKYVDFLPGSMTVSDATISQADQYASNGIYHVIDKALVPQPNLWEYITSNPSNLEQNDFISSLNEYDLFNSEDSTQVATEGTVEEVDNDTLVNEILKTGYYIKDEKKKFTYFVMKDDGFEQEASKMMPYTQRPTQDSTETLAKYYVARDMIFKGIYKPGDLPATLTSVYGVEVPIDKSNIVGDPIKISNGIVYVMDVVDVPIENKLQTVIIQGEEPASFSQNDKSANTFYRERTDPSGKYYEDIEVRNHGVPRFTINYHSPQLFSTTYKVYWRAINDFEGSFWQHVRIGGGTQVAEDGTVTQIDPVAEYDPHEVPPYNYDEVYVGDFTLEEARDLMISLVAENTGSDRWNPLTLDYLKLVPIVE